MPDSQDWPAWRRAAFDAGYTANSDGVDFLQNPTGYGTPVHGAWFDGWMAASKDQEEPDDA